MSQAVVVVLVVVLLVALVLGPWLLGTATRLDRLHVRTDAAWAGMDAALARRAVVARAGVAAGSVPSGPAGGPRSAADRGRVARPRGRGRRSRAVAHRGPLAIRRRPSRTGRPNRPRGGRERVVA